MNLSLLFDKIAQEQRKGNTGNTDKKAGVTATAPAVAGGNTGNTSNTENYTDKVLITVYTPLGNAMNVYADNQEQADFMLRVNPPPDKTEV